MELQRAIGEEHIQLCAGRSCLLTHRSAHASASGAIPPRARPRNHERPRSVTSALSSTTVGRIDAQVVLQPAAE